MFYVDEPLNRLASIVVAIAFVGDVCAQDFNATLASRTNHWILNVDSEDIVGAAEGTPTSITFSADAVPNGLTTVANYTGETSVITLSPAASYGATFTLCGWFKTLDTSGFRAFARHGTSSFYPIMINNSAVNTELGAYTGVFQTSGYDASAVATGWHHVAVVANSSSDADFYIDGSFVGDSAITVSSAMTYLGNSTSSQRFAEYLSDIMLFSGVTLSSAQIAELYLGAEPEVTSSAITDDGTPQIGETLTASVSEDYPAPYAGISDIGTVTKFYRWFNVTDAIEKQAFSTTATYVPEFSDVGDTIRLDTYATDSVSGQGDTDTSASVVIADDATAIARRIQQQYYIQQRRTRNQ